MNKKKKKKFKNQFFNKYLIMTLCQEFFYAVLNRSLCKETNYKTTN